jgi:hypothetical protein
VITLGAGLDQPLFFSKLNVVGLVMKDKDSNQILNTLGWTIIEEDEDEEWEEIVTTPDEDEKKKDESNSETK